MNDRPEGTVGGARGLADESPPADLWIGGADEALSYAVMREQVAPCAPCPD